MPQLALNLAAKEPQTDWLHRCAVSIITSLAVRDTALDWCLGYTTKILAHCKLASLLFGGSDLPSKVTPSFTLWVRISL